MYFINDYVFEGNIQGGIVFLIKIVKVEVVLVLINIVLIGLGVLNILVIDYFGVGIKKDFIGVKLMVLLEVIGVFYVIVVFQIFKIQVKYYYVIDIINVKRFWKGNFYKGLGSLFFEQYQGVSGVMVRVNGKINFFWYNGGFKGKGLVIVEFVIVSGVGGMNIYVFYGVLLKCFFVFGQGGMGGEKVKKFGYGYGVD